jgi:hypothetical protein
LKFSLVDLVGKELRFIGDEIVKAGANARDGIAVVVHHPKSETDGQEQAGEVIEVEGTFAARCGKGGFHAIPGDENGGEGPEEVLAHSVEEAEILREQIVDRLKDELQEVWLLHGVGSFDLGCTSAHAYGMRKF